MESYTYRGRLHLPGVLGEASSGHPGIALTLVYGSEIIHKAHL